MMGYTHYWETYAMGLSEEAVARVSALLAEAHAKGIVQYEHNDARAPLVTRDEIRFNGVGDAGHETFHFNIHEEAFQHRRLSFDCCKTARKPYDDIVMKVLILLTYYLQADLPV